MSRALRATAAVALAAAALAPAVPASACQWEVYERTFQTPAGPVTVPFARCVSP